MKVQISKKLISGELYIKVKNRTFISGAEVFMDENEFYDSYTQTLINKGMLIPLEEYDVSKVNRVCLRSLKKNPITFSIIKRSVTPNEKFFVTNEQLVDSQIQKALELGFIELFVENIDVKEDLNENDKTETKEIKKTNKTERNKKESKKKEMHVFRPKGIEINEPPSMVKSQNESIFIDLESGLNDNDSFIDKDIFPQEEISFVDKEQTKERTSKRKIAGNNEEIS